jgi:hypothetical protein
MDGGYPCSFTERWMVSRIFFWRTVRLLGAFCGWELRAEAGPPPVAFAAMFANALPFRPRGPRGALPGLSA